MNKVKTKFLKIANEYFNINNVDESIKNYKLAWDNYPQIRKTIGYSLKNLLRKNPTYPYSREQLSFLNDSINYSPNITNGNTKAKNLTDRIKSLRKIINSLGIESIYVVNLKRRPDRLIRQLREFKKHGIEVNIIEADDALESPEAMRNHSNLQKKDLRACSSTRHIPDEVLERYKKQLTPGVFSYLISQRKIFSDCKEKKINRVLVFDDDIFFTSKINEIADNFTAPLNYKIFMLGSSEYLPRDTEKFQSRLCREQPSLYHPEPGYTCGSFAVAYESSAFDLILGAIEEAAGPYDNVVLGSIYRDFPSECYSVTESICIPDVGESDIREGKRAQESHSELMNWDFIRYDEFTRNFRIAIIVSNINSISNIRNIRNISSTITSKVCISIFYPTTDGLRPLIPGHHSKNFDHEFCISPDITNRSTVENLVKKSEIANSDLIFFYTSKNPITTSIINDIAINHLSGKSDPEKKRIESLGYYIEQSQWICDKEHSIIIPTYRDIDHILPTIYSALKQENVSHEVIIVCDNPTIKNFKQRLMVEINDFLIKNELPINISDISIVEHAINRNGSSARNTGLLLSRGQYITFLDDDDTFSPNRLYEASIILDSSHERIGACYCGYTGSWNGTQDYTRFKDGNLIDLILELKYSAHYINTNTVTYKRTTFDVLTGFNESYKRHQDLELISRFFDSFEIISVKKFLVQNRPSKVPETFNPNLDSILKIKFHFISDFRNMIRELTQQKKDQIIDAHVKDIMKHDKEKTKTLEMACKSMLHSLVDLE